MAKTPVMETTVTANTKAREVIVTVEHEDWQSFSRAVTPRARKEFKSWLREHIVFGSPTETDRHFAWHTTPSGRCISRIHYSY